MDIYERAKSDLEKLCHALGIGKHIHESKWGLPQLLQRWPR